MEKETTLILVKPNAIQRGLAGKIISRFEDRGFIIRAMKMLWMTGTQAEELYKPHVGKDFYEKTVEFMTSSPIVAMVIGGEDIIRQARKMMGSTNPQEAAQGSIRGDFAQSVRMNCIHGSDSPESAKREIPIFFGEEEIIQYSKADAAWL
jgi:nucleoside-diphosphate kinase